MKSIIMKFAVLAFMVTGMAVSQAHAADVAKIGVVDLQRFILESDIGKAAQARIDKETSEMEADLEKKGGQLETLKKKLERDVMVMSENKKEQQEREYRIQMNDFKTLQRKYSDKLRQLEQRLVMEIQEKALALAENMGKKGGYLLLLEKTATIYYPQAIDVTDKLIEMANKQNLSLDGKGGDAAASDSQE